MQKDDILNQVSKREESARQQIIADVENSKGSIISQVINRNGNINKKVKKHKLKFSPNNIKDA